LFGAFGAWPSVCRRAVFWFTRPQLLRTIGNAKESLLALSGRSFFSTIEIPPSCISRTFQKSRGRLATARNFGRWPVQRQLLEGDRDAGKPSRSRIASAASAWIQGSGGLWLIGGILLGLVTPFTLIVILPTNRKLLAPGRLVRYQALAQRAETELFSVLQSAFR